MDSCALAAGQCNSSAIGGRIWRPVTGRAKEWTAPADPQPSQSAEVWEEQDFKETCPRPAQPRPRRLPSRKYLLFFRASGAAVFRKNSRNWPVRWSARCWMSRRRRLFSPLRLRRVVRKRRGEQEPMAHGLPAKKVVLPVKRERAVKLRKKAKPRSWSRTPSPSPTPAFLGPLAKRAPRERRGRPWFCRVLAQRGMDWTAEVLFTKSQQKQEAASTK